MEDRVKAGKKGDACSCGCVPHGLDARDGVKMVVTKDDIAYKTAFSCLSSLTNRPFTRVRL